MTSAQLGLEPGPLGYVWYIPYRCKEKDINGKDTGKYIDVVQFQIGYQGWLELMDRSGFYSSTKVHEVYDKDEFDFAYGDKEFVTHKPNPDADLDPKNVKYIYAIVMPKDKDCEPLRLVMSKKQIDAIKARSKSSGYGPWVTDYVAMGKKTVIKQIAKYAKKSIEIAHALTADETVKNYSDDEEDMAMVPSIDVDYSIVAEDEKPEIESGKKADDPAPAGFVTEGFEGFDASQTERA
jgi:recombination protein RecT